MHANLNKNDSHINSLLGQFTSTFRRGFSQRYLYLSLHRIFMGRWKGVSNQKLMMYSKAWHWNFHLRWLLTTEGWLFHHLGLANQLIFQRQDNDFWKSLSNKEKIWKVKLQLLLAEFKLSLETHNNPRQYRIFLDWSLGSFIYNQCGSYISSRIKHFLGILQKATAYSKPSWTSKIRRFAKIVNGLKPLTIFAKSPI